MLTDAEATCSSRRSAAALAATTEVVDLSGAGAGAENDGAPRAGKALVCITNAANWRRHAFARVAVTATLRFVDVRTVPQPERSVGHGTAGVSPQSWPSRKTRPVSVLAAVAQTRRRQVRERTRSIAVADPVNHGAPKFGRDRGVPSSMATGVSS